MKTTKHIFLAAALCLCSVFGAQAAYNGTPVTPKQINSSNYTTYGFTSTNYSAYNGWYAISNAEELYGFAELVNGGREQIMNGVLTDDIVVNENVLRPNGYLNVTPRYTWIPIGIHDEPFFGKFDGQGHTISGLYFENPTKGYCPSGGWCIGLFGVVANKWSTNGYAEISNVGVVDSYFYGVNGVGGICGDASDITITNCFNSGTEWINGFGGAGGICGIASSSTTIINCYNTGYVNAQLSEREIGGICGINFGIINNCYNVGTVLGIREVGGICGVAAPNSIITNCHNIGSVRGSSNSNVGGICGNTYSPVTISNNYYLRGCAKAGSVVQNGIGNGSQGQTTSDVSGQTTSATAEEFASGEIAYLLNGSVSGGTVWHQNLSEDADATPVLDKSHKKVYKNCNNEITNDFHIHNYNENGRCSVCGGTIPVTSDGYYEIADVETLYWFANAVNSGRNDINGKLTADIVVNENVLKADGSLNGLPTESWTPIGTRSKPFAGKFDGQGHVISGLYYDHNYGEEIGLIGNANHAEISNVGVVDSYFYGNDKVGGICGIMDGTIINCFNAGTVRGNGETGGICGIMETPRLYNCFNVGMVFGMSGGAAGGICGAGHAINSYNLGTIIGQRVVGGICGTGSATNCYYLVGCAKDVNSVVQCGIGGNEMDSEGCTTSATIEEFANGKIAYLLNSNSTNIIWYQTLHEDPSPVLDATHGVITGYIDEIDNIITVNGNWVATENYEIPEGKTLVVPTGTSVTTTGDAEITNNGTIKLDGGTISGNNLAGSGNFIYTQLANSDITLNATSFMYKGSAYTLGNGLEATIKDRTYCGKQFTFDDTGYTVSYNNNTNVTGYYYANIIWDNWDSNNHVLNSRIIEIFNITPNTNVKVTITGNSNTATYNTEEQSISGYTVDIEDETGVYTENDFTFSGTAAASGTTIGTYSMGLSADDFSNTNTNFAEVQFVVTDGVLTINKAENAPDMPTAIETYYINTERVALPDNWQWVENIDLEKGDNTATAEYVGEDADNYENVSVEVVVTRTACPHNEGYTTINTAEPTCTEEGYTGDHLCNICNEVFEQGEAISANGHTYSNTVTTPTCTEIGYTTHTCSVCEFTYNSDTVAAKGHEADSVVFENIVAATCAAAGSRDSVVYCTVCQAEVSRTKEEVAKLPHTEVVDAAVAATCTAAGKTEGKHCSVCEAVLVAQEEVAALGHNFGEYVYNNDAATDADGTETATCSRCGEKDTRTATGTKLPEPEKGTAVAESAANEVNIYAHGSTIVIENATEEICVYNAMGALVCRDAMPCVRAEINIIAPDVYIVKTGSVVKRVVVN